MKKSKLATIRQRKKLSRYRVCQDTGIPYNTLMRLEDPGTKRLGRREIRILSEYYGPSLTLEDLIE